jgi:iron(III) transport system substrate-binding protein
MGGYTLHPHRRSFLAGASAALLTLSASRDAAGDDWKAEWERTIALAKREGAVTVSASTNRGRREFIVTEWKKAFPEIELSYQVVSGSRFIPTVVTERRAGKFLWDVYNSGPPSGLEAIAAGLLDPLLPELILPDVKDPSVWGGWSQAFYDPEQKYLLGLFRDITSPYYNAQKLDPARVSKLGLKILLEPDLKGRIFWLDPRGSGAGEPYLALLDKVLGAENLRRILVEQEPIFVQNNNEAANAIVRGRGLIALSNHAGEALTEYKNAGLHVDIRPMGNTPETGWRGTGGGTIAVYNQRPHPNAARLFVNWLASRDTAAGLSRAQQLNSARNDVLPIDKQYAAIPGANYLDGQRAETMVIVNEWKRELKKLRPQ